MGSFDEISKTAADGFNSWLDEQLPKQKLDKVVGFNFNCYEDADHHWAVELVGTSAFSEQITDWAWPYREQPDTFSRRLSLPSCEDHGAPLMWLALVCPQQEST